LTDCTFSKGFGSAEFLLFPFSFYVSFTTAKVPQSGSKGGRANPAVGHKLHEQGIINCSTGAFNRLIYPHQVAL